MGYGITNGKVVRRKGKGYIAFNPMLIKNKRDGYGRSGFKIIWNFGTVRSTEISAKANAFWKEVELVFSELISSGKIYAACAERAKNEFEKYIPKPSASVPVKPIANPLPVANALPIAKTNRGSAEQRVRERFKDLL